MAPDSSSLRVSLGIDFGTHSSKEAIAQECEDGTWRLWRVRFAGDFGHPERQPNANAAQHEFLAYAALEDDQLRTGRQCQHKPHSYPLKTILAHYAGVGTAAILELPWGPQLLNAVRLGMVNREMEEQALIEHATLLHLMAKEEEQARGIIVQVIILTYPHYLCKEGLWFHQYRGTLARIFREAWGIKEGDPMAVEISWCSEAQALALYVCEIFKDESPFNRERLFRDILKLTKRGPVNFLFADNGGSTMNLHVQTVYFDDQGVPMNSQANFGQGFKAGARCGSQLSDSRIQAEVRRQVQAHAPPAAVASIMRHFEEMKWEWDYTIPSAEKDPVTLRGPGDWKARLTPKIMDKILREAFRPGLIALETEIKQVAALKKDFVILLSGGSFGNPGFRKEAEQAIERARKKAGRRFTIRYAYLGAADTSNWSSAVASGAALSWMRVPDLVDVFDKSAIAIQVVQKSLRSGVWVGENVANFMFCKGGDVPDYLEGCFTQKDRGRTRLRLVCDPTYNETSRTDTIRIEKPEVILNGPFSAYDLGWSVPVMRLPPGKIQIFIGGSDIINLTTGEPAKLAGKKRLTFRISCYGITERGHVSREQHDKSWILGVETDPASKLATVADEEEVPAWCRECMAELVRTAYICPQCAEGYGVCDECFDGADFEHEHELEELQIPSLGWPVWCDGCYEGLIGTAFLCSCRSEDCRMPTFCNDCHLHWSQENPRQERSRHKFIMVNLHTARKRARDIQSLVRKP